MSKAEKVTQPSVNVVIGGRERELKFTMYALCKLEEVTGKNALTGEIFWRRHKRHKSSCIILGGLAT